MAHLVQRDCRGKEFRETMSPEPEVLPTYKVVLSTPQFVECACSASRAAYTLSHHTGDSFDVGATKVPSNAVFGAARLRQSPLRFRAIRRRAHERSERLMTRELRRWSAASHGERCAQKILLLILP
jgi:hypothetical protein